MIKIFRLLLPALFLACAGHAADEQNYATLFEKGYRLYAEGDYEGARKSYQEAVDQGACDAAIFLNLGLAEYKLGRPALALINYKRALALDPSQDVARANLEHVEKEMGHSLAGAGFDIGHFIPYDWLALIGSLLVWGGLLCLLYAVISNSGRRAIVACGIVAVFLGAAAVVMAWKGDSRVALRQVSIVIAEAGAYDSPTENSAVLRVLKPGDPIRVLNKNAAVSVDEGGRKKVWSLIQLPNDRKGWVGSEGSLKIFEPILPDKP